MKKKSLLGVFLTVWLLSWSPLRSAEFRWLAFGDSITLGNYDFAELGGYPGRLSELLNCSPGICEVYNAGKSGEKTYQAVTRIHNVLNNQGPFDVMMLMEGTNDIFLNNSVESVISNLGYIANQAKYKGTDPVMASIIWYHPDGTHGTSKDDEVEGVRDGVENLAMLNSRYFVDIWDVLCPDSHPDVHGHNQTQCFNRHYSDVPNGDDRGHPVGSGYTMMANAFYGGLLSVPVPGVASPVAPDGTTEFDDRPTFAWNRESPVRANWYRLIVEGDGGVVVDRWVEASRYCQPDSCLYTLSFLEALDEGEYTWRLLARNPAGAGNWSADYPFEVLVVGIFDDGFESGDTRAWSETQ